ncbi:hypothetical protein C8J57DRAFT_1723109 [Mycena rebaudengoi]|nr:hypothetical protein C8J57DRAFT_1723109 [Mycena rebaudengoi]
MLAQSDTAWWTSLDVMTIILDKYHWMLFFLVTAMFPRFLITVDEELNSMPVTVRVGQAIDVVGQAGKPRTISGFQTHQTPVRLATTERAELATEEYIPFGHVLEGFFDAIAAPAYARPSSMLETDLSTIPGLENLFSAGDFASPPLADYYSYDWSAFSPATELPTLPVPPASSPPFSSDMVAPPPEPPMRAKDKRKEVDEKDVVVTRRVLIKRTRSVDNLIGQSPSKKARPTSTRSTRKSKS